MRTNIHLDEYLKVCSKYIPLDIEHSKDCINNLILEYYKKPHNPNIISKMKDLEVKWYKSLEQDRQNPDYSVYGEIDYLYETWLCWAVISRQNLTKITRYGQLLNGSIVENMTPQSVVDLGCGAGLTTSMLCEIFPTAKVTGTNFEDSYQFKIASEFGSKYGFTMLPEVKEQNDLVFASEYFEHILEPIKHLNTVLDICEPKWLLIANTFTSPAIGHFNEYLHDGVFYTGKQISKIFSGVLKERGYIKVKTNCWNNRPQYWKRKDLV